MKVSMLPGVRRDPEHRTVGGQLGDGEGNAVEGERALIDAESVNFRR